jgi:hypothetical protein
MSLFGGEAHDVTDIPTPRLVGSGSLPRGDHSSVQGIAVKRCCGVLI